MHLSRFRGWIVLAADVLLIFTCNFFLFLPALLRSDIQLLNLVLHIGFLTLCVLVFQLSFKTYESLWRYAESREYLVLLMGMSCGYGLYAVANLALRASLIWIVQALTARRWRCWPCCLFAFSTACTASASRAAAARAAARRPSSARVRRRWPCCPSSRATLWGAMRPVAWWTTPPTR